MMVCFFKQRFNDGSLILNKDSMMVFLILNNDLLMVH